MTNVPRPTFGPTGFIAPTEPAVLEGVLADIDEAFGGGLNPALDTPQGQLATSEAAIIGNANDTFVYFTNQVDPAFAQGRMQDAIARIYFIERNPAQPTVVQALCSGLAGVVIPVGALAVSTDGNLYQCTEAGTIPLSGQITRPFSCVTVGPVPCPAGGLNQIYQAIPGWDSITNPTDGVLGNDVESRADFEARRAASVAGNSVGSLNSILGAVLGVPNVLDAYVTENDTGFPQTVRGQLLAAHSLYVAAYGGDADAIARAIWTRKAPGCSYNGNTTVVVYDTNAGYSPPLPSYDVTFEIPPTLPILFSVELVNSAQVPADAAAQIQAAIMAAFAGSDGGARARIGSTIYASRYYAPVAALGSWAQIVTLLVGSGNTAEASIVGSIAGDTLTVTHVVSGTLEVGQTLIGSGIVAGTKIASLGSGTGGTGTYLLSNTQNITSIGILAARADRNSVEVQINQVPTIAANNIAVRLT